MNEIIQTTPLQLPEARVPITIRPGTMEDITFLDALQKKTTKQVGWMPTKQFEGKAKAGHVLVAERCRAGFSPPSLGTTGDGGLKPALQERVGYLIGNDQYFKRDDVGIIYQINVIPEMRRSLVAASLLKAQFERSAYGCRLYCCWCAQDIEANRFWESMGFVALAFRTGSMTRGKAEGRRMKDERETGESRASPFSLLTSSFAATARVHIFWQKRIRAGDDSTAWWFPSKTDSGAMREDRIVLPIQPGTHWSEVKPILLPNAECRLPNEEGQKALPETTRRVRRSNRKSAVGDRPSAPKRAPLSGGVMFALPTPEKPKREPSQKTPRAKAKIDPKFVAAARELRDRYLEQVNEGGYLLESAGKYDLVRTLDQPGITRIASAQKLLAA